MSLLTVGTPSREPLQRYDAVVVGHEKITADVALVRVRADGTGGSQHVHGRLAVGDVIRVAGPKAMFPLEEAPHHLLVAGGIGVTPVLTMAEHLARLDVLLEAGADILWSCREGTCASCETPLLEGEADHRDQVLTPDEKEAQDCVFPCVSRARCGRLVLDLPSPAES